jgi:predicted secreted protein
MSDFKNGVYKLLYIYVDNEYFPIGCLTSNSFSEQSDMLETTTRQNAGGWKTSIPTNQSYSISFSGLITTSENGNNLSYRDIQALKRNKTQFYWKTNSEVSGYFDFGRGYITSLSSNAEIDSFIDFSAEIIGYGEVITQEEDQSALNYTLNVTI